VARQHSLAIPNQQSAIPDQQSPSGRCAVKIEGVSIAVRLLTQGDRIDPEKQTPAQRAAGISLSAGRLFESGGDGYSSASACCWSEVF
jgi:hypothetical protein